MTCTLTWCNLGRRTGHQRYRNHTGLRDHRRGTRRGSSLRRCLRLLPLQNCLQRIPGLRDLRKVELRPVILRTLARPVRASAALDIRANLHCLIGLDRTGVRLLLGHSNCCERVQDGPALHFQFPCQIVDSNFVHPSLFSFPAALAVHVSLIAVAITIVSVLSECVSAFQRLLRCAAGLASHGRARPCQSPRLPSPAPALPSDPRCRYPAQSPPRAHPHR